jgi:alkanesulfonate monooxygenase SsuD/methylene tetrahydromethanopterin reductase-like flavin-dependent oxidoreductase (luciferase family)
MGSSSRYGVWQSIAILPEWQPRKPRLGLNLPYVEGSMAGETPRWRTLLAMATTAEAIGFEAIWISDHVGFGEPERNVERRVGLPDAPQRALPPRRTRVRLGT